MESWLRVEEYRDAGSLVIKAQVPGIDPDTDADITVTGNQLQITVRHEEKTQPEDIKGYRSEFRYGTLSRTLTLPAAVDPGEVKASYTDGVLEIRVPVPEQGSPETQKAPSPGPRPGARTTRGGLHRGGFPQPLAPTQAEVLFGSAPPGPGRGEFAFEAPVGRFKFKDQTDSGQVQAVLQQGTDPAQGVQVLLAVPACSADRPARLQQTPPLIQPEVLLPGPHQLRRHGNGIHRRASPPVPLHPNPGLGRNDRIDCKE